MVKKSTLINIVIILFHLVGLYGFLTKELQPLFIKLVPFHLLLMLFLMIISGYDRSRYSILFVIVIYFAGFFIEVLGVNTGLIFGSYEYGGTLGLKVFSTPLLIGVNWLILVYTIGVLLHPCRLNKNLSAFLGAIALVSIDVIIEPVAIRYDYWTWSTANIPLQNYVGWFVVSYIMLVLFQRMDFKKQNPSAIVLLVAQVCFFIVLNNWGS